MRPKALSSSCKRPTRYSPLRWLRAGRSASLFSKHLSSQQAHRVYLLGSTTGLQPSSIPLSRLQTAQCHIRFKTAPDACFPSSAFVSLSLAFFSSKANRSPFIFRAPPLEIFILIYVDDILIIGSSMAATDVVFQRLQVGFSMKDLGQLNFFLGIEAQFHSEGLFLSQEHLLKRTNMSNAKLISINHVLSPLPYSVWWWWPISWPNSLPQYCRGFTNILLTHLDLLFAVNHQPPKSSEVVPPVPTIHLLSWAPNHPQLLYSSCLLRCQLGQLPSWLPVH